MPKSSKAKASKAARFEARLERLRSRLNWIIIYVPFGAAERWGLRGQIKVKGEINGFAFRTSLFPTREGRHFLLINKRMQKGARAAEGSVARFEMEVDREERIIIIPAELKHILGSDRALRRWYDELNHSTRNEISRWVTGPEGADARKRRAEQIAERMLAVMDAERELPPILRVAFARHPRARVGWDAMSPARRRTLLFAIFYYQTPEARGRRIDKVLEQAESRAEKISDKRK
jgi:uncharacterized protein YdeI (YjbR/CyaY-like superfamily)